MGRAHGTESGAGSITVLPCPFWTSDGASLGLSGLIRKWGSLIPPHRAADMGPSAAWMRLLLVSWGRAAGALASAVPLWLSVSKP